MNKDEITKWFHSNIKMAAEIRQSKPEYSSLPDTDILLILLMRGILEAAEKDNV